MTLVEERPEGASRNQSGLVIVDKPAGMTSHDVVSRVRRLAGTRKVGHAGTLDPMATGVLILGVNRATRLLGHLQGHDKSYDATIRLGASTTTDDAEGSVIAEVSVDGVTEQAVRDGLAAMVGEIDQVPSAVSAIKVDGRKAYDRVRAGEDVVLPARRVRIDSIEVTDIRWSPSEGLGNRAAEGDVSGPLDVDISVRCSSGTYIRAIARDLGTTLGVGGHLTALRRTSIGGVGLDDARTLEKLADRFELLPIAAAARASFASVDLDEAQAADVRFGRKLDVDLGGAGPVAVFAPGGDFLALYEQRGDQAAAVAVFV